ncbi:MAG: transmembrane sensor [Cyclobacteriaceae bacterium]|jgi:ferric-dicitrate binding protein FerR (iron transport regulator)
MNNWLKDENTEFTSVELNDLKKITEFPMVNVNNSHSWDSIATKIESKRQPLRYQSLLKIAAVITLLLCATLLIVQTQQIEMTTLSSLGNQQEYKLPDGSYILLDRNSEISFNANFEDNRALNLAKGKIFLDVQHNGTPFNLRTDKLQVQVLGTSFSVDNTNNIVHVFDGLVSVSHNETEVKLKKGKSALLVNNVLIKTEINKNSLSWKTGQLEFENATLSEVISELNTHFNTEIRYSDALSKCLVSASFKDQSLKETVKILSIILNAKASFKNQKARLSGQNCK